MRHRTTSQWRRIPTLHLLVKGGIVRILAVVEVTVMTFRTLAVDEEHKDLVRKMFQRGRHICSEICVAARCVDAAITGSF